MINCIMDRSDDHSSVMLDHYTSSNAAPYLLAPLDPPSQPTDPFDVY